MPSDPKMRLLIPLLAFASTASAISAPEPDLLGDLKALGAQAGNLTMLAKTEVVAAAAGLSCFLKTGCPAMCDCTEQNCTWSLRSCLADQSCQPFQSCVNACKCNDNSCLDKCSVLHPPRHLAAANLLKCMEKNCPSAKVDAVAVELPQVVAAAASPDCSKSGCPATCACGEKNKNCAADLASCLADQSCLPDLYCVNACACSDDACLQKCSLISTSKALDLFKCMELNCPLAGVDAVAVEA